MLLENSFEVPAPVDRVWAYLLDVEKVVPCMPGGELTETLDETHWKGRATIKVGPVSLTFAGKVTMAERDDAAHRVVLQASGMEQRGKGAAQGTITSTLEEVGGATRVNVVQDLKVSGQVAQYSRGMMQDVTARLTQQFADCLKANIEAAPQAMPGEARRAQVTAEPIKGGRLGLAVLAQAIRRFFAKLFGKAQRD